MESGVARGEGTEAWAGPGSSNGKSRCSSRHTWAGAGRASKGGEEE